MPKKSFKDNPALRFITTQTPPSQEGQLPPSVEAVPVKPNPLYVETRSKRVQLLMQPSLHRRLRAIAGQQGLSVNELIHRVLAEYADRQTTE